VSRPPTRKNGKPYTAAERARRYRIKKSRQKKRARKLALYTPRTRVVDEVHIHPIGIDDITETDLASGSVDAIITDPPYAESDLDLHRKLGLLAMRALKPSGWCLALVGQVYLNRIIGMMDLSGMCWRGLIMATFPGGPHSRLERTFQARAPPSCRKRS
jgi:hypothetical protein